VALQLSNIGIESDGHLPQQAMVACSIFFSKNKGQITYCSSLKKSMKVRGPEMVDPHAWTFLIKA
jgi:hypothetical protein